MKRKVGIGLCVLGVLLTILGILWVVVLWPILTKFPADLDQKTVQQGIVKLYNAERDVYESYSVLNARHYVAIEASDEIVYLDETITFTDRATDQEISSLRASYLVALDRVTRRLVEGRGDGIGGGYIGFPFNVSKNKTYPFWNEGNPANLDCGYIGDPDGEEVFEGLRVYVFRMKTEPGQFVIPAGFARPNLDTYQPAMTIDQDITLKVEPISGVVVYMESTTKRSGRIPVPNELFPATGPLSYKEVTFYEDNLKFTDETIADLVKLAKSSKMQLTLAKFLSWMSISAGVIFLVVGIFLARQKERISTAA